MFLLREYVLHIKLNSNTYILSDTKVLLGEYKSIMNYYSRIYKNKTTSIPLKIREKYDLKSKDTAKWVYNSKTKELKVEFNEENYENNSVTNQKLINTYQSSISQYKNVTIPIDIIKIKEIDYGKHLLEWKIEDKKILVEKAKIPKIYDLAGLIDKGVVS